MIRVYHKTALWRCAVHQWPLQLCAWHRVHIRTCTFPILQTYPPNNFTQLRTNFTHAVPELLRNLQSSATLASHPMLVLIVIAEWQMNRLCSISFRTNAYLLRIEDMTGHPVIRDRKSEAKLDNHQDLTLQLSRVSYQISAGELFTGCLTEQCDFITESLDSMRRVIPEKQLQSSQQADQLIYERLGCIMSSARHAKLKFTMYEKRTQFQLSTVYQTAPQTSAQQLTHPTDLQSHRPKRPHPQHGNRQRLQKHRGRQPPRQRLHENHRRPHDRLPPRHLGLFLLLHAPLQLECRCRTERPRRSILGVLDIDFAVDSYCDGGLVDLDDVAGTEEFGGGSEGEGDWGSGGCGGEA